MIFLFLFSFILCAALSYIILYVTTKYFNIRNPSDRDIHSSPIPRYGGIAIFLSVLLTDLIFTQIKIFQSPDELIFCSSVFLLGLLDDVFDLKAIHKLIAQIILAGYLALSLSLQITFIPFIFTYFFTIFWILWILNGINFIDGMDGLSSGVTSIILFGLLFITGEYEISLSICVIVFVLLGFMIINGNPAKMFMGDSGSLFLGSIISIYSIRVIDSVSSLILVLLVLFVPLFDILWVVILRLREGKPIMSADNKHIHHRINERVKCQRTSVTIIYGLMIIFTLIAYLLHDL